VFSVAKIKNKKIGHRVPADEAMKSYRHKTALTLIEILVTVGIIAVLVSITVSVATRIDSQAREKLLENTFALLDAALEQFSDFEDSYDHAGYSSPDERDFYTGLDFPVDCNRFPQPDIENEVAKVLNVPLPVVIDASGHDPVYSSSEAMYLFLSRVPECRQTLNKIDGSLITNLGTDNLPMTITIGPRDYPLLRIVDPWGTTLKYDYYNEEALQLGNFIATRRSKRNFPLIISAGPDRRFGTGDDMTNR